MKKLVLLLVLLLAGSAHAQDTARIKFRWTQPDTTTNGHAMVDGQVVEYQIFLAANGDTNMVTTAPAPAALADSAWAYVTLEMGVPSAVAVVAVDRWGNVGPRSLWSDTTIAVPEPPSMPGKPEAVEE